MQSTCLGPSLGWRLLATCGCIPSWLMRQLHHGSATWNVLMDWSVPSRLNSVLLWGLSQHSSRVTVHNTVQGWLCIIFACLCAVKISLRVGCASAAVQSFGRRPWAVALPIVLLWHVASRLGSAVQIRQMCKGPLQFPGTNHACWSVVLMQALLWLPSSIDLHFGSANGSSWSDLFCELWDDNILPSLKVTVTVL